MTEQLNIPELRRLHAAATPGEWCYDDGVTDLEGTPDAERGKPAWITTRGNKLIAEPSGTNGELACIPNLSEMDANGKCIAASHNALPALLDAAEERDALKAKLAALVKEVDDIVEQGIDDKPETLGYSVEFALRCLRMASAAAKAAP